MAEPVGFRDFVEARSASLLRTAWMLTGETAAAEDLLQTALARTWPHWAKVGAGRPDAYVRTVMVRTHASWRSRRWHGELPTDDVVTLAGSGDDEHARVEERVVLASALATLPVRQRQAVVLRYFDDLSVEDVAEIMNSSTGTVKSQSAKGLAKLRDALGHLEEVERR
ncbi:SigE family RNA polymerase sigma factor [Nocardioides hankookensis]|uniref:SigE family RNA polymerase sigma factor n=1 Tax=Nocardioides hankookensis TaxID=443157 RepID=A0ABW1LQB8_9ACTN